MAEEAINTENAETATAIETGNDSGNNNTSTSSEAEKTQKNSPPQTVPYSRFKDVNDELNDYKTGKKSAVTETKVADDSDTVLELIAKVPDHLKGEMPNIAKYAKEHAMPVEDAITLWDARNRVSTSEIEQAKAADLAAANSTTGGTSNPQARQENTDISKLSTDDLRADLEKRISSGEKI